MTIDELEVGKWYTESDWQIGSCGRFENTQGKDDVTFVTHEFIYDGKYHNKKATWSADGEFEEVPIESIKKFLPDNYVFDNIEEVKDQDYTYLIDLFDKLNIK